MPPAASSSSSSRKRARDSSSSEERREARAERNRIAAQISRDRRKAEFSRLEQRVAELEQENFLLRTRTIPVNAQLGGTPSSSTQRENDELRERVRVLERGWEAVTRALAAQGLNAVSNLPSPAPTSPDSSTSIALSPAPGAHSPPSPTHLRPVALPSLPPPQPTLTVPSQHHQPTRHPAAGGSDADAVRRAPSSLFVGSSNSTSSSPLSPFPPPSSATSSVASHSEWFPTSSVFPPPSTAGFVTQPPSLASSTGSVSSGGGWDEDRQRASALELERLLSSVTAAKDDPGAEQPWPNWNWLQNSEVAF